MLDRQKCIDEDRIAVAIEECGRIGNPSESFLAGREAWGGATAFLGQELPIQLTHLLFLSRSCDSHVLSGRPRKNSVMLFGGGRLLPVLIDAQPPNLRLQRLAWYPEFCSRAGGPGDPPVAFGESRFDHLDLTIC